MRKVSEKKVTKSNANKKRKEGTFWGVNFHFKGLEVMHAG